MWVSYRPPCVKVIVCAGFRLLYVPLSSLERWLIGTGTNIPVPPSASHNS